MITGTKADKRGEPVAWVKPLFEATTWHEADPEEFPSRGYLFWPQAKEAIRDALVFVRPKENTAHPQEFKDEFMVAEAHAALEVLDLRSFGTQEQIREGLSTGVPLSSIPPTRSLIWCCDNVVVGPVGLVDSPNGTTLEKSNRHRIPCFHLKQDDIRTISYDGMTRHVCAKTNLGPPDSFVDWDDDRQVVRRAIEFAAGLAKKSGVGVEHSRQLAEEAAEQLAERAASAELRWRLYELDRTRRLIKLVQQSSGLATEVVGALRKHPAILKELDELRAAERQSAKAETEAALKSEREELARLQKERVGAELALKEAMEAIEEAKAEGTRKAGEIEKQIRNRIDELIRGAPALLGEIAVLKPFLGGPISSASKASPEPTCFYPRWKVGPISLSTTKELRSRIVPLLKAHGVQASTYQRMHAAFAAKLLPVLAGPRALDALKVYAQVATGGRVAVVQVTTSLAEAGDVFGRINSRSRFVPHPGGLIDVVLAAQQSEGLMLVVLDGINRGATESYLLPLLRMALRRSAAVVLFHPSAVNADDPYQTCSRIDWPQNLLLAATLVEGPTTLPVAPDVWADSVLIATDEGDNAQVASTVQTLREASEIDPKSALLWLGDMGEQTASDALEGLVKSRAVRQAASRFERALAVFQTDPTELHLETVRSVLVPCLASITDDEDRAEAISDAEKSLGPKSSAGLRQTIEAARRSIG